MCIMNTKRSTAIYVTFIYTYELLDYFENDIDKKREEKKRMKNAGEISLGKKESCTPRTGTYFQSISRELSLSVPNLPMKMRFICNNEQHRTICIFLALLWYSKSAAFNTEWRYCLMLLALEWTALNSLHDWKLNLWFQYSNWWCAEVLELSDSKKLFESPKIAGTKWFRRFPFWSKRKYT